MESKHQLRERDEALAAIAAGERRAESGAGNALFILGEAGLGKTSLLEEARELVDGEFEVAVGRGEEMEQSVPFGLLGQVLETLGADPAEVLGDADARAVEASVPYLRALRWLRGRIRQPTLILLDDLHWADSDSLKMLAFLTRRLRNLPVALVGTLRPWPAEAWKITQTLMFRDDVSLLELHALNQASALTLFRAKAGLDEADPIDLDLLETCGGNPLLIELAAAASRSGQVRGTGTGIAALQRGVLLSRFAGLDETSLHCARCASLAGMHFRIELAVKLAGLEQDEIEGVLDALTLSGLVIEVGDGRMRFAQPLFAQALYEELPPARRRRLHRQAFEILAEAGLNDQATEHAIRAQMVGHRHAAEVAENAGMTALAQGAVDTAVRDFEAAIQLSEPNPSPGVILNLARALLATLRLEEAEPVCERLLNTTGLPWTERVEALSLLSQARYLSGAADLGVPQVTAAVELATAHDPGRAVKALLDQSVSAWMASGPKQALPLAAEARELARKLPLEAQENVAALWGQLALESGDPAGFAAAAPIGERLVQGDLDRLLNPAELIWPGAPIYWYAHCAHYTERFDDSLKAMTLARDVLETAGAANGIAIVTGFIASHLVRRGRLREALDETGRAVEFSELTPLATPYVQMVRAEALLWSGQAEKSEADCAAVEAMDTGQWLILAWLDYLRGLSLLWRGEERASENFIRVEERLGAVGLREPRFMPWAGHAIEAHLNAGNRDDAERVLASLETAATPDTHWPRSAARLAHGRILAADGENELAELAFEQSIEALGQIDLPLRKAESLLAYGSFLRRRKRRTVDARAPLAEANGLAEEYGAIRLAEFARAELKLAGGRRRRSPVERDNLTAAELRVARLAADGHTNAEIAHLLHVSTNTVRSQLKQVYSKLGIDSRQRLATMGLDGESTTDASGQDPLTT